MDKDTLKANFKEALKNYKKISQQTPNVFSASDRELDAYYNSILLAESAVEKVFDEALNYKGD